MVSQTELDSLRRQVEHFSQRMARNDRDHFEEIKSKDNIIAKKMKRTHILEGSIKTLTTEKYNLKESLQHVSANFEAKNYELKQLKKECKVLCDDKDATTSRLKMIEEVLERQPGAQLRMKIKLLCLKYHPDRHELNPLNNVDVTRDLIELLEV